MIYTCKKILPFCFYCSDDNTWEPESHLCKELLEQQRKKEAEIEANRYFKILNLKTLHSFI